MRMTTRTSLAMKTLMFCAVNSDRIVRRSEIAETYAASENHLAQVIHLLAQKKFLHTIRGRAGGLRLGRPAELITVGQVFRAFERVLPFAECFAEALARVLDHLHRIGDDEGTERRAENDDEFPRLPQHFHMPAHGHEATEHTSEHNDETEDDRHELTSR